MKRTSSGSPPGSPPPIRRLTAPDADATPTLRRARVRAEWSGMHHPGRPTVAVLVVGRCEQDAAGRQLDAWQRRAREVGCNYCVIEAGDVSEDVTWCADVLRQQVPGDAMVVLLQSDDKVSPDDFEGAQSALGFAGLVRRSRGPFLAGDGNTHRLPVFPAEASLARQALIEGVEPPAGEATDLRAECDLEARLQATWRLQRHQRIAQVDTLGERVESLARELLDLAGKVACRQPPPQPAAVPPLLQQQLNALQLKPHWQTSASTTQATRLMHLLLRVGSTAEADSPASTALQEIVRAMAGSADDVVALLAAVDQWPADVSDQAHLILLMRALREHEVASGVCDGDPVNAPRWLARCVVLSDRLQAWAASAFATLGGDATRNPGHEAGLRDYVEQSQLALLLGLEDALPDATALSAPGFDPVAGVLFAAMLQAREGVDSELDAFMAQWAPWQTMVARLTAQGRWPPDEVGTDPG